jgi:hypothetical protein
MKQRQGWIIGAAIGYLLIAGLGRVKAKELPLKGNFAGTFLSARIDRNDDGLAAGWETGVLTGNPGKRTYQGLSEAVPTGPTAECPGGVFIIDAQNGKGFGAYTETYPNGDQLYGRVLTRTFCSNGVGGFTGSSTFSIIGGTGKFAGASRNGENSFVGFHQAFDANASHPRGLAPLVASLLAR